MTDQSIIPPVSPLLAADFLAGSPWAMRPTTSSKRAALWALIEHARRRPTVKGRCPNCGHLTLFLGDGGHVTCSSDDCTDPGEADARLRSPRPAFGSHADQRLVHAVVEASGGWPFTLGPTDAALTSRIVLNALRACLDARRDGNLQADSLPPGELPDVAALLDAARVHDSQPRPRRQPLRDAIGYLVVTDEPERTAGFLIEGAFQNWDRAQMFLNSRSRPSGKPDATRVCGLVPIGPVEATDDLCAVTSGTCDPSYAYTAPVLAARLDEVYEIAGRPLDTAWDDVLAVLRRTMEPPVKGMPQVQDQGGLGDPEVARMAGKVARAHGELRRLGIVGQAFVDLDDVYRWLDDRRYTPPGGSANVNAEGEAARGAREALEGLVDAIGEEVGLAPGQRVLVLDRVRGTLRMHREAHGRDAQLVAELRESRAPALEVVDGETAQALPVGSIVSQWVKGRPVDALTHYYSGWTRSGAARSHTERLDSVVGIEFVVWWRGSAELAAGDEVPDYDAGKRTVGDGGSVALTAGVIGLRGIRDRLRDLSTGSSGPTGLYADLVIDLNAALANIDPHRCGPTDPVDALEAVGPTDGPYDALTSNALAFWACGADDSVWKLHDGGVKVHVGQDKKPIDPERFARAVVSAHRYRDPSVAATPAEVGDMVNTDGQLKELPVGAVVRSRTDAVFARAADGWQRVGAEDTWTVALPARVLDLPSANSAAAEERAR